MKFDVLTLFPEMFEPIKPSPPVIKIFLSFIKPPITNLNYN